ncbi:MAG: LCP family protein [Lachnospiraceae bacterium]|nr:LCP family protein [Lachnospiraceae bacterium]
MKENKNYHKEKKDIHATSNLIIALQILSFITFIVIAWNSRLFPIEYIIGISLLLVILFVINVWFQMVRKKRYITGTILNILMLIILAIGTFYIEKAGKAVEKIGGATYKTDNMIAVVKKENSASTILDLGDFQFGSQMAIDNTHTILMIENINRKLGKEVNMTTFDTLPELAQALLDGKVDVVIYNEALAEFIEESIPEYSNQVKIIYHYEIDTELEVAEVAEAVKSDNFSVYISGIDVEGPITTNSRSDVNIIATVNPTTKQILLTTTPRDYYVLIPGVSGDCKDKLTHSGIYGVDASMKTLNQLYGITLDYYMRVNFTSLIKIIDILGGVEVNSEYAFEAGGYSFQQGSNHLDGKAALTFVRERYAFIEGDNQRGRNQEAVLAAIIQKLVSPGVIIQVNSIVEEVSASVETNMSSDKISELIRMQLEDGAGWNIVSINAIGTGDIQPCFSSGVAHLYVMQPNIESVMNIINKMQQVKNGEVITQ